MDTSACIISEITQGIQLAKQLKSILSSDSFPETKQVLIQEIISSYDKALMMVNWCHTGGQTPPVTPPLAPALLSQPESSVSIDESPRSGDFNQTFDNQHEQKPVSKKRKAITTWKNQIRISTDTGLEGNTDDGYSWRKYGQKDILGAKFPRSYYRCTYRYIHHCMARKQVQRADEDPMVFEITYRGQHTCNPSAPPSVAPPQSPEKHETGHNNHQLPPPPKSGDMLSNLRQNLRVCTSDSDAMVPHSFSFPSAAENYQQFDYLNELDYSILPSFISPATSGTNYFTERGGDFQHHDDSHLSGITTASATNSPLAFPTDSQDFSQNFPFNSGFFI
ncbi:putative WRKY transcription factor 53 [Bidens hawaiensis]|uniref:putative WRKY transcription factor 53 n=1 Tax=Bidens hawaiensis TaxID=980011 RepID=UPI00404B30F4